MLNTITGRNIVEATSIGLNVELGYIAIGTKIISLLYHKVGGKLHPFMMCLFGDGKNAKNQDFATAIAFKKITQQACFLPPSFYGNRILY